LLGRCPDWQHIVAIKTAANYDGGSAAERSVENKGQPESLFAAAPQQDR